jgi:predicted nuclease with TOPRIM domain
MALLRGLALFSLANALSNLGPADLTSNHRSVTPNAKSKNTLPEIKQLLPLRAFTKMKSTVAALEKRLAAEHRDGVIALSEIKAEYERGLAVQRKNNSALMRDNTRIASEVEEMNEESSLLRRRSSALVEANDRSRRELESLSSNLSLAKEFVQDGLDVSAENASEVQVLDELAELDEAARAVSRKQSLLQDFTEPFGAVSLLEADADVHERSAGDIMETLMSGLSKLSDETNNSRTSLRVAFEQKLTEEKSKHDSLLQSQIHLNKTKSDAQELRERLSVAFRHLSNVHEHLQARIKAIRTFALRLGGLRSTADSRFANVSQESARDALGVVKRKSRSSRRLNRSRHLTASGRDTAVSGMFAIANRTSSL